MGCSTEATQLRTQYAETVTQELEAVSGTQLDWDLVATVMKKAAFRVVGPTPPRHLKPWLQGKENELHQLEANIHQLEVQLRAARRQGSSTVDHLQSKRRCASSELRTAKRRWEASWWDDLAAKANTAGDSGDDYAFWQICKQLGFRESTRSRTGCKRTCANLDQERAAWKTFLSGIQSGEGAVDESVWESVPAATHTHETLANPLSRAEFDEALRKMKFGKRGGIDDVTVELIRFGSSPLKDAVFQVVTDMWNSASTSTNGLEADKWSSSSKTGVCIPMFKNKGSREDKANYRNLVMLSVSAKLVARVVASRLSDWGETWLAEEQDGFRPRRGIDDMQQFIRRVLEEVSVAAAPAAIGLTCFDIVRAYTRVCRVALWQLLTRLGVPQPFLKILKALHEHTTSQVFVHNGYSEAWLTDRGLREGCPSSPVLFSIFHHAIMCTFRDRRAEAASTSSAVPGLVWNFKVDGRVTNSSRGVRSVTIGDVEFADDTAILGWQDELIAAEKLFVQTLQDWEQQEHPGKREKLAIVPGGRGVTEVLNQFEARVLKHLGATRRDSADQWTETKKRVQAGFFAVKRIAQYWSLGTERGRGKSAGLATARKLRVMRCVLEGTLLACCKTRVWSLAQERKANQVLARGIRRCLGLDRFNMREFGYSDEALRHMVQWDHFTTLLHRTVLNWVGHVARMDCNRLPKIALFGWPEELEEHRSCRQTFPMWVQWLLSKYNIPEMDWFRLAQKPTRVWIQTINEALPRHRPSALQTKKISLWRPGEPTLQWSPNRTNSTSCASSAMPPPNPLQCPVCPFVASSARGLQVHYDGEHAVQGGNVTTVQVGSCPLCHQAFVHVRDKKRHKCPNKPHALDDLANMRQYPTAPTIPAVPVASVEVWRIFTDGAGPQKGVTNTAGWGVAIWEDSSSATSPTFELFGPVCIYSSENRWIGAESHTNNVGELSAMVEALLWLEAEAPGNDTVPAVIYYDSTYAFNAITGQFQPEANTDLVFKARNILSRVRHKRAIEFEYVKGHSGNPGNDHADRLAGKGSKGQQSTQSARWLIPLKGPPPVNPLLVDHCWRCGVVYSGPSYARQLAGHEAYCKIEGAPPSHIPCRNNCGKQFPWKFANAQHKTRHHARELRNLHEKICRGSPELNAICPFCDKRFPQECSDEYLLSHRASCDSRPPDAPSLSSMWKCSKCQARIPTAKKSSHTYTCRGSAQANKTCQKCKAVFQTADCRSAHENTCRGTEQANRTCNRCNKVFSRIGARVTHEKACGR